MVFHRFIRLASMLVFTFWLGSGAAVAHGLLRDADLDYRLKQIAIPVLGAAGLNPNRVKIVVVNDSRLNAFVVNKDAFIVNSGLINTLLSGALLQAVVAHEAAHIANGHITRRMTNLKSVRTAAGLGLALAATTALAGGGEAAGGIASTTTTSAQRSFFAHTRAEEALADQSAIRYRKSVGLPPSAMSEVLSIFRGQEALSEGRQDPYIRSHSLTRDRLRVVDGFVAAYGADGTVDKTADYWFAQEQGKLPSYTLDPKWTLRRLNETPRKDVRLLREAVAHHQKSSTKKALQAVDSEIELRPKDPVLHDMRGQILLETRNFTAAAYTNGRAVQLAPNNALVLSGYGRALMASGQVSQALPVLERARNRDFRDSAMLRDLSVAYDKTGQTGMASLVSAERYALSGRMDDAGIHAKRASEPLSRGSGPWQRAQDVLIASERAAKRR